MNRTSEENVTAPTYLSSKIDSSNANSMSADIDMSKNNVHCFLDTNCKLVIRTGRLGLPFSLRNTLILHVHSDLTCLRTIICRRTDPVRLPIRLDESDISPNHLVDYVKSMCPALALDKCSEDDNLVGKIDGQGDSDVSSANQQERRLRRGGTQPAAPRQPPDPYDADASLANLPEG
jgi:hypothetical protein